MILRIAQLAATLCGATVAAFGWLGVEMNGGGYLWEAAIALGAVMFVQGCIAVVRS